MGGSEYPHGQDAPSVQMSIATPISAGANGLAPSTVAPADAPGHEHNIAGAADAAAPACTSPSAFDLDKCMASAWFRFGAAAHGAAATPTAKNRQKSRKQVTPILGSLGSGAQSNGPTRPALREPSQCPKE